VNWYDKGVGIGKWESEQKEVVGKRNGGRKWDGEQGNWYRWQIQMRGWISTAFHSTPCGPPYTITHKQSGTDVTYV